MVLHLRQVFAPAFWRNAKCLGMEIIPPVEDDDGNIIDPGHDPFFVEQDEALLFCNGTNDGQVCPAREECLLFALTNNCREGVWGGMSEAARRALRKRWPLRGKVPREEWHWMPEAEALTGISSTELEDND